MSEVNWLAVLVAGFASYWIGALSPAEAAARMRGADLRGTGSGNPGATNAARTMGVRVGIVVGLVDVVKGFVPVWFFSRYGAPAGQVAGLAAVIGHVSSPFLHGRGGKGVATSFGAILALDPLWAIPVLLVFGVTVALTRRVGIGSVAATLTLVPMSLALFESWWQVGFAVGLSAVVVNRHRRNLREFWSSPRPGGPASR